MSQLVCRYPLSMWDNVLELPWLAQPVLLEHRHPYDMDFVLHVILDQCAPTIPRRFRVTDGEVREGDKFIAACKGPLGRMWYVFEQTEASVEQERLSAQV